MLVGRELQKKINNREKWVLTNPMILGTDGGQMSKTSGNCIFLDDTAEDMYGKTMAIADTQIATYMQLLTNIPMEEIAALPNEPMNNKKRLAYEIVKQFHTISGADRARQYFETTFQSKNFANLPEFHLNISEITPLNLLDKLGAGESNADKKRLIRDGAVSINNQKITDPTTPITLKSGDNIKIGKTKFYKLIVN
jgi:tyrosyl-tRNA synthetase